MNEVLANRAAQLLDEPLGTYQTVHPNDHVNRAQSTNDVIPTGGKLTLLFLSEALIDAMEQLAISLEVKAEEYRDVTKVGRTHLQDAVITVSYTHLTLPTKSDECRSRWSPYH